MRAYLYDLRTGQPVHTIRGGEGRFLASGPDFGKSVALSTDGKIIAVGASKKDWEGTEAGHVSVFSAP